MLLRSPERQIGFGRPLAAVLCGLILPAVPGTFVVFAGDTSLNDVMATEASVHRHAFLIAASLMTAPLLALAAPLIALVMVVLMGLVAWMMVLTGWAGPVSLVLLSWLIGVPFAHSFLNGDLTTEAPEMIPLLAVMLAIQALSGWFVLRPWRQPPVKTSPMRQ